MVKKVVMLIATGLAVAVGLFLIVNAFGSGLVNPLEEADRGQFVYAWVAALAGVAMIAGVVIMKRSPRTGAGLMIAGAVLAAGWHFWMLVIGGPIALVIVAGALLQLKAAPSSAG
ncbi:MAG: hypothetical protein ACR2M4_04520 [Actinomycetota bacterium]